MRWDVLFLLVVFVMPTGYSCDRCGSQKIVKSQLHLLFRPYLQLLRQCHHLPISCGYGRIRSSTGLAGRGDLHLRTDRTVLTRSEFGAQLGAFLSSGAQFPTIGYTREVRIPKKCYHCRAHVMTT